MTFKSKRLQCLRIPPHHPLSLLGQNEVPVNRYLLALYAPRAGRLIRTGKRIGIVAQYPNLPLSLLAEIIFSILLLQKSFSTSPDEFLLGKGGTLVDILQPIGHSCSMLKTDGNDQTTTTSHLLIQEETSKTTRTDQKSTVLFYRISNAGCPTPPACC